MARQLVSGIWVIVCDWIDPVTNQLCALGVDGNPAMFVDPSGGKNPDTHFQCGRHHGIIPQAEKPEFQLPEDHKLNTDVLSSDAQEVRVEDDE